MENLDNISDDDLRIRLTNAGQKVGPITNTTRGVYKGLLTSIMKEMVEMSKIPVPATPAAKRPAPAEEEEAEETFVVKKKKGVLGGLRAPAAPSLRRSTVASTELSKLAAMTGPPKRGIAKRTRPAASDAKSGIRALNTTSTFGTNRLNTTVAGGDVPNYMKSTTSAARKGGIGGASRLPKGGRRSGVRRLAPTAKGGAGRKFQRSADETKKENEIPKVAATTGKIAKAPKKKRAPWDVKGKLEDVTCLYQEIKGEKKELEEKVTELEELTSTARATQEQLTERAVNAEKLFGETSSELMTVRDERNTLEFDLKVTQQKYEDKCDYALNLDRQNCTLQKDLSSAKDEITHKASKISALEQTIADNTKDKEELVKGLEAKTLYSQSLEQKISTLEACITSLRSTISNRDTSITTLQCTIDTERSNRSNVEVVLYQREEEIKQFKTRIAQFEQQVSSQQQLITSRDETVRLLKEELREERGDRQDIDRVLEKRVEEIRGLEEKLAVCMEKMQAGEKNRRKLHNTIQELKGNIRVYCRVRPFLGHEMNNGDVATEIPQIDFSKDQASLVVKTKNNEKLGRKGGDVNSDFTFDHVFNPHHGQAEAFEEVAGLVQSALDGFNVCIFAYGQTGSGKTHTMEGPDSVGEHRGMIPRAMEQIFETAAELELQGWSYTFTASIIEIYNETLHDLLNNNSNQEKIEIKLVSDKTRDVEVTNVKSVEVKHSKHVQELLEKASKNRSVAATKCNERSSRSHSVFRLKIEGHNTSNGEACVGDLNLVDLAGSERVAHSGSTGQRLKEAQAINTSLSELGNVIMALNEKKSHVPYRNSKLTYLLCNSLGGNSKTLMFVNVSPLDKHTQETINSLRFATKVNRCDIGTAKKNS